MIHEDGIEEKTMQAYLSEDTSCTQGFNFKTAGAVDAWLATRPVSSQPRSRAIGFGEYLSNGKTWSNAFA
jgi:hypothetical protein